MKNLKNYQDLCVQNDTLLFADIFENLRDICLNAYNLIPAHFPSVLGLSWIAALKKIEIQLK